MEFKIRSTSKGRQMLLSIFISTFLRLTQGSYVITGEREYIQGSTIVLTCSKTSLWEQDTIWYADGYTGPLINCKVAGNGQCTEAATSYPRATFRVIGTQVQMSITNAQVEDSRTFSCSEFGAAETGSITVNIKVPITSVKMTTPILHQVTVSENIGFHFTCETSEGKPSATIQWYKKPETGDAVHITVGISSSTPSNTLAKTTSTLTFLSSRYDHDYIVYCTAFNIKQSMSFTSQKKPKLYVQYPANQPNIQGISGLGEYQIIDRKQQSLTCTTTGGRPLPSLILTCLNYNISGTSTTSIVTSQATWTASRDQDGQQCTCRSTQGVSSWNKEVIVTIKVLYPPTPPIFTVDGQNAVGIVSVIEQSTTIIICHSSSLPAPTYTWSPQEASAIGGVLTLSNMQSDDDGNRYTCTARNSMVSSLGTRENGTASNFFSLNILHPPKNPVLWFGENSGQSVDPTQSFYVVREDDFSIHCQFTSVPAASSYQWTGQTESNDVLRVTGIQTDSTWTCTAYNTMKPSGGNNVQGNGSVTLTANILYGPSSPRMTYHLSSSKTLLIQSELRITERRSINVSCGGSDSKPNASYSWLNPEPSSSEWLELSDIGKQYNDKDLTCIARNKMYRTYGQVASGENKTTLKLVVLYRPSVHLLYNVTIVENKTFSNTCKSEPGNPPETRYTWTLNDGSTINQQTLSIQRVTKVNIGMYKCEVWNHMNPTGENTTLRGVDFSTFWLNVLYGSSISKFTINGNLDSVITVNNNSTLSIHCLVDSNPGSTISIKRDNKELHRVSDRGEVTFSMTNVRCTDFGVYSCTAFNEYNENSRPSTQINVTIKSPPVAVEPENNTTFYVAVHDSITVSLTVCAYPLPRSVEWYKLDNNTVSTNTTGYKTSNYPQYNLTIQDITMTDLGVYQIILDNGLTPMLKHQFYIEAQGPPEVPQTLILDIATLTHNSLHIKWTGGFNGGSEQTFYIQYKFISDTSWTTLKVADTGEATMNITLTGLNPGTVYEVRVYAGNAQGNSSTSEPLQFTTKDSPSSASNIGVIAGAVSGSVAALIIIVVIVFLQRRFRCIRGKQENEDKTKMRNNMAYEHNEEEDEEDEDILIENAAYVSAGPYIREDASQSTEYATVNKPKVVPGGDIYAQVNKKKPEGGKKDEKDAKDKKKGKGKAERKKKGGKSKDTQGDTYENAEIGAVGQRLNDENLYELTDTSATSSRKVNEDGLIYIDVVIDNNNKKKGGQNSNEIHGKDDMTEYTMIDFYKRADPLPDSDTEGK